MVWGVGGELGWEELGDHFLVHCSSLSLVFLCLSLAFAGIRMVSGFWVGRTCHCELVFLGEDVQVLTKLLSGAWR